MEEKNQTTEETLAKLAKEHLSIYTLEIRNSDRLDFHDVSVWGVKAALEAAYTVGVMRGREIEKQKRRKLEK